MALTSMHFGKCFDPVFQKLKRKCRNLLCLTISFALTFLGGCGKIERRLIEGNLEQRLTELQLQSRESNSPFLKAHMRDGQAYVLSSWKVDSENQTVIGHGELLDINREMLETGEFTIPVDSAVIFETNIVESSASITAMTLITGASIGLTAFCIANPKACFGSCPTFYVSAGDQPILQAEGFSASVAPILEASDIDALYYAQPTDNRFEIQMKNEALETHVVRHVDLLVVKRQPGGRVFLATDGTFWGTDTIVNPSTAVAPQGDCLTLLQDIDGQERFSEADSRNLATREILEVEFENVPDGRTGLVIAARQSLMSTFLFYQGLAYLGHSVGEWTAALERGDIPLENAGAGVGRLLGGIEVLLQDDAGQWISVGAVNETGPLATDVHLVKLPRLNRKHIKIRLRLTSGHWRLDAVKLVALDTQLDPIRLSPVEVNQNGSHAEPAQQLLTDPDEALTTLPGDNYTLVYQLPNDFESYELFLESRGYYLEWIRKEWLADEDPALAAMMLSNPERALRVLAPEFKKIEANMEEVFWKSRYEKPQ